MSRGAILSGTRAKTLPYPRNIFAMSSRLKGIALGVSILFQDPAGFFKWFFTQQKDWGLMMYEQDWMCTEYDGVDALQVLLEIISCTP